MHKTIVKFALRYGIRLGRLPNGHYVVRGKDGVVDYMAWAPGLTSGLRMCRRYRAIHDLKPVKTN